MPNADAIRPMQTETSFFLESTLVRLRYRTLCSTLTIVVAIQFLFGLLAEACFGDVGSPGFGQQYVVPEFCVWAVRCGEKG